MKDSTKDLIDEFLVFLQTEFTNDKHLKHVQFEKASVAEEYKVKIKYYYKGEEGYFFIDLRELKDNKNHFSHLKENIINQLANTIDFTQ